MADSTFELMFLAILIAPTTLLATASDQGWSCKSHISSTSVVIAASFPSFEEDPKQHIDEDFPQTNKNKVVTIPQATEAESAKSLKKQHAQFIRLSPHSVIDQLAFYEAYPDTEEGLKALQRAWYLLSGETTDQPIPLKTIPRNLITTLPFMGGTASPAWHTTHISMIETLSTHLQHHKLLGSKAWTRKQILALPDEEIDVGRALLLEQLHDNREEIRKYEAVLNLMALQIKAKLNHTTSPHDTIQAISEFIFHEMRFRFPPHALYAKDVDLYTFLPSVLDGREGVCLGVSILYICLAQRLGLPLEIITPPGHIYVRYRDGNTVINIETTARGIHLPSETYLGIDTHSLQARTLKELVGLAYINQAAAAWTKDDHAKALTHYRLALDYLPHDPLLKFLTGINLVLSGNIKEGRIALEPFRHHTFSWAVSQETLAEDFLEGRTDRAGLKAVFLSVNADRASIMDKQAMLSRCLKRYPRFRAGLLQSGVGWLQLGRLGEAERVLQRYHDLDPTHVVVEYYLTIIALRRANLPKAWHHFQTLNTLSKEHPHNKSQLRQLRYFFRQQLPEKGLRKTCI